MPLVFLILLRSRDVQGIPRGHFRAKPPMLGGCRKHPCLGLHHKADTSQRERPHLVLPLSIRCFLWKVYEKGPEQGPSGRMFLLHIKTCHPTGLSMAGWGKPCNTSVPLICFCLMALTTVSSQKNTTKGKLPERRKPHPAGTAAHSPHI